MISWTAVPASDLLSDVPTRKKCIVWWSDGPEKVWSSATPEAMFQQPWKIWCSTTPRLQQPKTIDDAAITDDVLPIVTRTRWMTPWPDLEKSLRWPPRCCWRGDSRSSKSPIEQCFCDSESYLSGNPKRFLCSDSVKRLSGDPVLMTVSVAFSLLIAKMWTR